jgi:hypothetical protein
MQTLERIFSSSPHRIAPDSRAIEACIEACAECERACAACADACLGAPDPSRLRKCIRLNLDCADICNTSARVLTRQFHASLKFIRVQLEACALVAAACGAECLAHAEMHRHCRFCADACKRCEEACRKALRALPSSSA